MRIFNIVRQQRRTYWVGAAIGAAGSILGGLLGRSNNSFDPYAALYTTQLQKDLFDYQFSKQLEAMNSAHQREVADLRKAGLNPILSATGGSGLSSPSSGMPDISGVNSAITQANQANKQMKLNAVMGAIDRALQYQSNEINQKSVDVQNKTADANLMNANTNAVDTASKIQQRAIENTKMDSETKKHLQEISLLKSQEALNSAYSNQAFTNAWYQRQILPSAQYKNEAVPLWNFGTAEARKIVQPYFNVLEKVSNEGFQRINSAYEAGKSFLKRGWNAWTK